MLKSSNSEFSQKKLLKVKSFSNIEVESSSTLGSSDYTHGMTPNGFVVIGSDMVRMVPPSLILLFS